MAGEQVGYIGLLIIINAFTVDVQGGAVVNTLTQKTFPVVKPGLRLVGMIAHVPLAKKAGLVTRLLQIFREKGQIARIRRRVIDDRVAVRVQAGQDRGATG